VFDKLLNAAAAAAAAAAACDGVCLIALDHALAALLRLQCNANWQAVHSVRATVPLKQKPETLTRFVCIMTLSGHAIPSPLKSALAAQFVHMHTARAGSHCSTTTQLSVAPTGVCRP